MGVERLPSHKPVPIHHKIFGWCTSLQKHQFPAAKPVVTTRRDRTTSNVGSCIFLVTCHLEQVVMSCFHSVSSLSCGWIIIMGFRSVRNNQQNVSRTNPPLQAIIKMFVISNPSSVASLPTSLLSLLEQGVALRRFLWGTKTGLFGGEERRLCLEGSAGPGRAASLRTSAGLSCPLRNSQILWSEAPTIRTSKQQAQCSGPAVLQWNVGKTEKDAEEHQKRPVQTGRRSPLDNFNFLIGLGINDHLCFQHNKKTQKEKWEKFC